MRRLKRERILVLSGVLLLGDTQGLAIVLIGLVDGPLEVAAADAEADRYIALEVLPVHEGGPLGGADVGEQDVLDP